MVLVSVGSFDADIVRASDEAPGQGTTLAESMRFRIEFGLTSDPEAVASIIATEPPSPEFGIPLSRAEQALMERRFEIPTQLTDLATYRAAHENAFGGIWFTYPNSLPGGISMVLNVGTLDDQWATLADITALVPRDVQVEAVPVRYSEAELNRLVDRVATDPKFFEQVGAIPISASLMTQDNLVEITLDKITDTILAAANARYGANKIRLVEGTPLEPDTCTRLNCGPPWKSGIRIYSPAGNCTSGFAAKKYLSQYAEWVYALWTAGHCGNATWRQGTSTGIIIGTTVANYFANNSAADVQVIPINVTNATNFYLDGTSSCNPCNIFAVTAREGYNTDYAGQGVCNHGSYSGTKCGTIVTINDPPFTYLGASLVRMRRATYTRMPGDSGGPVTSYASTAEGSHTHYRTISGVQYAMYSQVYEMESASGYTVLLTH